MAETYTTVAPVSFPLKMGHRSSSEAQNKLRISLSIRTGEASWDGNDTNFQRQKTEFGPEGRKALSNLYRTVYDNHYIKTTRV
ncbi:hypothetical protein C0J52_07308 [Blattella germanica]|nr:hypothetical protein C0J52_07308 [Blattella germanica]